MRTTVPKKVKTALTTLNINNVVKGYSTQIPTYENARLVYKAAFTCWDADGKVVCVLIKGKNDADWKLKH